MFQPRRRARAAVLILSMLTGVLAGVFALPASGHEDYSATNHGVVISSTSVKPGDTISVSAPAGTFLPLGANKIVIISLCTADPLLQPSHANNAGAPQGFNCADDDSGADHVDEFRANGALLTLAGQPYSIKIPSGELNDTGTAGSWTDKDVCPGTHGCWLRIIGLGAAGTPERHRANITLTVAAAGSTATTGSVSGGTAGGATGGTTTGKPKVAGTGTAATGVNTLLLLGLGLALCAGGVLVARTRPNPGRNL